LLVDDYQIVRTGLRTVLQSEFDICGEASDGEEAVSKVLALKPDLVIMDVSMPVMNGIAATRKIHQVSPSTKVVILTMHDSAQMRHEAMQAGALACLTKTAPPDDIKKSIAHALEGAN
jgi:two-component system NarL family response regulator